MLVRKLRLWSGILIAIYVVPHVLNHALGLVSLNVMEKVREALALIWFDPPGALIIILAFAVHFSLSLATLYNRSTLRMPVWEATQIGLGLLIFPLLLAHVIGTQGMAKVIGFVPTYELVISALWINDPIRGVQQTFMMFVVWGHMCVGLHFLLRLKPWYRRWLPLIYGLALLIPVLSFLGFANVGEKLAIKAQSDPKYLNELFQPIIKADPEVYAFLKGLEPNLFAFFVVVLVTVLVGRGLRRVYLNRHGVYRLSVSGRKVLTAPIGQTILETLRIAGVPHASVCGGRGRCTTCRVHVGEAWKELPNAGDVEKKALARIKAEPEIRLACQTSPRKDLKIEPLLPPNAGPEDSNRRGGIQGREQKVVIMFIDIRGSTKLGEDKLPYDVLFILNQFFAEMAQALEETEGHYAQFIGDGLMGLYGINGPIEAGCRNAIQGAALMAKKLDILNTNFKRELQEPLRMGVGVHVGDVIVGDMGPPDAQNFSAIGDEVNVAARLEALSKDYGCFLVLSKPVADLSGVDLSAYTSRETKIRGREGAIEVFSLDDPRILTY